MKHYFIYFYSYSFFDNMRGYNYPYPYEKGRCAYVAQLNYKILETPLIRTLIEKSQEREK